MLEFLKSSLSKLQGPLTTPPRCVVAKNALSPTAIDWINEQFVRSRGKDWGLDWPYLQGPLISSLEFAKNLTKEIERKNQIFLVPRSRADLVDVFVSLAEIAQKNQKSSQALIKEMRAQLKLPPLGILGSDLKNVISDLEEAFSKDDSSTEFNKISQLLLNHLGLRNALNKKGLRLSDWEWMEAFVSETSLSLDLSEYLQNFCRLGTDDILENLEFQFFKIVKLKSESLDSLTSPKSPYFWALDSERPSPLGLRSLFDRGLPLPLDLLSATQNQNLDLNTHPVLLKKSFFAEFTSGGNPFKVFPDLEAPLLKLKEVGFGLEAFKNSVEYFDFLESLELFRPSASNENLKIFDPHLGGSFTASAPPLLKLTDFTFFPSIPGPIFVCGPGGPQDFLKTGNTGMQYPEPTVLGSYRADEILISNGIHLPQFKESFETLKKKISTQTQIRYALKKSAPTFTSSDSDNLKPLSLEMTSSLKPSRYSPSSLEALLKCPLQFGLERRLKLSATPVDDPLSLDPLGAGTWIHAGLENFFKTYTPAAKDSEIDALLSQCLKTTYSESFRKKPSAEYSKIIEAHIPGLVSALKAPVLDFETRVRAGFRIENKKMEFEIQAQLQGSPFVAKIDRIDTLKSDASDPGGFLIIDYKTGSPPREKPLTQVLNKNFQWFLYSQLLEEYYKSQNEIRKVRGGGYFQPLKPHQSCFFVFASQDPNEKLTRVLSDFSNRWDCKFYSIDAEVESQIKNELHQSLLKAEEILKETSLKPQPLKPATCKSCRVATLCGLPLLDPNYFKRLSKSEMPEEAPSP